MKARKILGLIYILMAVIMAFSIYTAEALAEKQPAAKNYTGLPLQPPTTEAEQAGGTLPPVSAEETQSAVVTGEMALYEEEPIAEAQPELISEPKRKNMLLIWVLVSIGFIAAAAIAAVSVVRRRDKRTAK